MNLPVHISRENFREPVISVDGAWDAPGLNLSHWPGNRTPRELKHDLSTGCALAFARLDDARRSELARGCQAIVNNHFDTDGTCALFAVRHPREALARESALLDAAAAGDFYQLPSERALCIDAIVGRVTDAASPFHSGLTGLAADAVHTRATLLLHEALPQLLDGDLGAFRELWAPELERTRADRSELARCRRDDVVHLDWTIWRAEHASFAERGDAGRHALFGSTPHDRVLLALPRDGGTCYRLLFSTLSWFDLVTRETQRRPDLAALAARLDELEGSGPGDELRWRAQPSDTPSPEVWFGTDAHEAFAERCPALRPSRLTPEIVRREISEALRGSLALPL